MDEIIAALDAELAHLESAGDAAAIRWKITLNALRALALHSRSNSDLLAELSGKVSILSAE